MSAQLDALTKAVSDNTAAVAVAVAAFQAGNGDTAALPALTSQIEANTAALTAAVTPPAA